ncbi:hypothetical protein GCM10023329_12040 [Streptomyces sanyensis]|uniref:Uncharacterized protein n=1 Tax=Streptomyces sanyensis TaxID=568869 RepID=A0ABP8ZWF0_9ACTN
MLVGTGTYWSVGVRENFESCQGVGDHIGPGPVACESQVSAAGGRDELGGCREEAEPEATGPHLRISRVRASMGIHASRSMANWTISSQIWFCAVSCRGRWVFELERCKSVLALTVCHGP